MDQLMSLLQSANLGGGVKILEGVNTVYISEVSSPSRLWIQETDNNELDALSDAMGKFYQGTGFTLNPNQVFPGMRIAAFACGRWDRAKVISFSGSSDNVKCFFFDFGTTGSLKLNLCRMLIEDFGKIGKKAFRAALSGISPVRNARLWDLRITDRFICDIKEKTHRIKIVNYHEQEDFYEFLLFDGDSDRTINEKMVNYGIAEKAHQPNCLFYPSFDMLEKLAVYQSFGDRIWALKRYEVDFNKFEEENISAYANSAERYEIELYNLLQNPYFSTFQKVIHQLIK